jgi:riboflavin kinase / FMN adenylyltransferase
MRVVHDLAELQPGTPIVLTIGAFDGVHLGHQWLIRRVVDRAHAQLAAAMVLTFDPRPTVTLRPGSLQLTDGLTKERYIALLDPDILAILPFSAELSRVSAPDFLRTLREHATFSEIWVGADFAFGHNRVGTVGFLIEEGAKHEFDVHVVARRAQGGVPISSTSIRKAVQEGDLPVARHMLGHPVAWEGKVVSGFGRGADLGFPTANLQPPAAQLLPAHGIYAAYLRVNDERRPAAVSVGTNPVFDGDRVTVEAYVLDFDGDIRGLRVQVEFIERIRAEQKFDSVDALLDEMRRDVARVDRLLRNLG